MAFRADPMIPWKPGQQNNGGGNNQGGGNGGGQPNTTTIPAFQPGQLQALAAQLNAGFGGGVKDWKQDLRNTFDPTKMQPFNYGGGGGGGGKGNNRGGNNQGGRDPRKLVVVPNGNQPMMARQQNPMPMQAQAPMMAPGLLSPMMQAQQPMQAQQSGLLGAIPPEVLKFIAQGGR